MEASGECQAMMRKSESCSTPDPKTLELVAIGASIGSGCDEWLEYHLKAAREAGATPGELRSAIRMAEKVRQVQIVKADKFSRKVRELLTEADNG